MLYVPEIPSPRSGEAWEAAAIKTISEMVDDAGGRALVLSTSRRMLQRITTELRAGGNHRVLMQGDADRASLLKTFRDDETSVLVATKSFFTGVDAPGPTLSLVVIDRLPFPAPNDPLIQAKRERLGSGGFAGVDLSEAAVGLNQAVGRLLRCSTDAGLVMVTDPRLVEVGYGKKLLAELPPMRLTRDRQVALRFLRAAIAGLV
jgi:ATP-dependent DNA helicase DinG